MTKNQIVAEHCDCSAMAPLIEPLADYITAADRPREALLAALSALFAEVQGTHRATLLHLARGTAESLNLAI